MLQSIYSFIISLRVSLMQFFISLSENREKVFVGYIHKYKHFKVLYSLNGYDPMEACDVM